MSDTGERCDVRVICGTRDGSGSLAEITFHNAIHSRVDQAGIEELRSTVEAAYRSSFEGADDTELVTIVFFQDPESTDQRSHHACDLCGEDYCAGECWDGGGQM